MEIPLWITRGIGHIAVAKLWAPGQAPNWNSGSISAISLTQEQGSSSRVRREQPTEEANQRLLGHRKGGHGWASTCIMQESPGRNPKWVQRSMIYP